MPGRYKAYPEYKHSDVEWIKRVPTNWEILSGRRIFINRRESSQANDIQLAASQKFGVVPQGLMMEMNGAKVMLALKGTEAFKHVEKSDFVISLRSFEGGIEYSDYSGCVSPAYTVLSASKQINAGFYRHLFKSASFISALQSTTDSLRDGKSITYEQFGKIILVMPPVKEQEKIANFLDRETAKIDTLIEKQQQLIKLLEEKRQAVISHAVTKGLNPDAPMKDSGVEWLGQVPEDWVIAKVAFRYEILLGKMLDSKKIDGKHLGFYLRNTDVQWDCINSEDLPEMDFYPDEQIRYSVRKGDLLVCEGGEIGRCAIWEKAENCYYQKALHRLRPLDEGKDFPRYMFYLMFDAVARERFISEAGKATIAHLPAESFRQYRFAFPSLVEQEIIVNYLDAQKKKFDLLESKAKNQIALLQERRTALISAAVTGKIDLRDWRTPAGSTAYSAQKAQNSGCEGEMEMHDDGEEVADD